jgi:hypothetical protein
VPPLLESRGDERRKTLSSVSNGLRLLLPDDHYEEFQLLELKDLGGGVVQLRYALARRPT